MGACQQRLAEPVTTVAIEEPTEALGLGFRELFRILVPGIYAGVLIRAIAPFEWVGKISSDGIGKLAISIALGIFLYAARVHEWVPGYRGFFGTELAKLNSEISKVSEKERDHTHEYKYFLEACVSGGLRDRIHYFSSFYYMLCAMSLSSLLGVIGYLVAKLYLGHRICDLRVWLSVLCMLSAFVLFGSLGRVTWRKIIAEQVLLVRDKAGDIKRVVGLGNPDK